MSDVNFFEADSRHKKKKKGSGGMPVLGIVLLLVTVAAAAFFTVEQTTALASLEQEKTRMKSYVESSDTKKQLEEYEKIQTAMAEIANAKIPISNAYIGYKKLNTVTGPLIDEYIFGPINENADKLEFKTLSVAGGDVSLNVLVSDTGFMGEYMAGLANMPTKVDRYGITKPRGAQNAEDDKSIKKFKDEFTYQITRQSDPASELNFEGMLKILINNGITEDMHKLLEAGQ